MEYDIVVIGGGPGGYVAAIKAAQLGFKVACIEKRGALGGTCLNVGCIPSKALLHSSYKYYDAVKHFADYGIECESIKFSLKKIMDRKEQVVSSLTKGIEGLFLKNKVTYIKGAGKFLDANTIEVKGEGKGAEQIKAKNIIIATGSQSIDIPNIKIDEKQIVSSTGALTLTSVPKKMVVIGAGYIGLEMGSVWARLGSKVTVVEYANRVTPAMDLDISKEFQKSLEKQGLEFMMSTKVISAIAGKGGVKLDLESVQDSKKTQFDADVVLVAIGRKPFTSDLGLEKIGIALDERGRIPINDNFATQVANVYAIGDVVRGAMLAHKAEEEGIAAVEIIAGQHGHVNYDAIPGVVYTHPEIASVGKTESEVKQSGIEYRVGKFPFLANSRARTNSALEGFVKIITDAKTDRILGAHIIGESAGELIQELVLGMEYKASAEDIGRTSHGHPGLSEAVKEAAMACYSKPIHI